MCGGRGTADLGAPAAEGAGEKIHQGPQGESGVPISYILSFLFLSFLGWGAVEDSYI